MDKRSKPLVSVVTPVHNGGTFLDECIQSILAQTYENFEYIIVNNCSTDDSLEIARGYAEKDPRIRVYDNKEFLTSLQNSNHSLRKMSPQSKYCKIVHADDWILPECIEKMARLVEDNPSVGIVGSYRLVNNKVESDGLPYQNTVFPGHEIARMNLTDGPYTFGTPSALLIRSDLVMARKEFYNEAHTGADTEVCLELLQECDFGFVHQVLSFYRIHEKAITGKNMIIRTSHPNFLFVYRKYGPIYLSGKEYETGVKKKIQAYYQFLGSQITRLDDKKFWKYHINAIENLLGLHFSWPRVIGGAVYAFLKRLVDTKQAVKDLIYMIRRI